MIIKVLFVILVLSSIVLAGVAIAVFVRVWWHLKAQQAKPHGTAEAPPENNQEGRP